MTEPVLLHTAIDEGSGEPLVLLHGWPQDSTMWRPVAEKLSARFRCIALDLRGLGRSPAPPDGYDKEQFARDVVHTLDSLGIERFDLIGHDWGGITAQLIPSVAPGRMRKAMVLDVPPLGQRSADPRQLLGIVHMPILASLGQRAGPKVAELILRNGGVAPADVDHYVAMLSEPERRHATQQIYRRALLEDVPKMFQAKRPEGVDLLFLGGSKSPITRWTKGVETIPGASHFVVDNAPDVIAERALAFF